MSTNNIITEIKKIYQDYLIDDENIDISLIDSFEFIQNILELEEMYNIEMDDEMLDFERFSNLQEIASYILEMQEENKVSGSN